MSWLCKLLECETEGQVSETSLCHSNTILSSVALRMRGNVENKPKSKLSPVICLRKEKPFKNFMFHEDKTPEVFSFKASQWSFHE